MKSKQAKAAQQLQQAMTPEVEEVITRLMSQSHQMRRLLWLAVTQAGGQMMIDETMLHQLWILRMEKITPEADVNNLKKEARQVMKLSAELLSDPEPAKLKDLAGKLLGTSERPEKALQETGLLEYPEIYIMRALMPYAVVYEDRWVAPEEAAALSQKKALNS